MGVFSVGGYDCFGDEAGGVVEDGAFQGGEVDLGCALVGVAQTLGDHRQRQARAFGAPSGMRNAC